mmetsp:Transcript_77642/g.240574  ORF Transcript_77642/g.240574 Transcript_77642/m.240574 type:complete len:271 (-) Transcript_77642:47-859(-)
MGSRRELQGGRRFPAAGGPGGTSGRRSCPRRKGARGVDRAAVRKHVPDRQRRSRTARPRSPPGPGHLRSAPVGQGLRRTPRRPAAVRGAPGPEGVPLPEPRLGAPRASDAPSAAHDRGLGGRLRPHRGRHARGPRRVHRGALRAPPVRPGGCGPCQPRGREAPHGQDAPDPRPPQQRGPPPGRRRPLRRRGICRGGGLRTDAAARPQAAARGGRPAGGRRALAGRLPLRGAGSRGPRPALAVHPGSPPRPRPIGGAAKLQRRWRRCSDSG